MLRPNLVVRQRTVAAIVAPLALLLSMSASHQAMAACAGSVASPNSTNITVLCNGVGATGAGTADTPFIVPPNLIDNNSTVLMGTTNNNNVLLQFDGQGRTLDNSGSIINNHVYTGGTGTRNRTAVVMGQSTINAGATTQFNSVTPGATTTTVALGPTFTAAQVAALAGQSLVFGTFDGDDFAPGQAFEIDSVATTPNGSNFNVVVTLKGVVPGTIDGAGDQRYSVVSNFGATVTVDGKTYNDAVINRNGGRISTSISATEITGNLVAGPPVSSPSYGAALIAVDTRVAGTYLIDNKQGAEISATHAGIGLVQAIFEGGQVTDMLIKNAGTIAITREAPLILRAATATANPTATSASFPTIPATAIGNAWTIATEEEAEGFTVDNASTGVIRSKGDYTATIYSRVEEAKIINHGTIEHVSSAGGTDYTKGFAIGAVSNGGGLRTMDVQNYGTINGDILGVNGLAVRWYLLSTEGVAATTGSLPSLSTTYNLAAGMDQRLLINSQTGEQSSHIFNAAGANINGNMWFSNGKHDVDNAGTVTGNIDVDQRATLVHSVTTSCTAVGGLCSSVPLSSLPAATTTTKTSTIMTEVEDDEGEEEEEGEAEEPRVVTTTYSVLRETKFGSDKSTITENIAVTPGARDFTLKNSGTIKGNVFVNQAQSDSYALPKSQCLQQDRHSFR